METLFELMRNAYHSTPQGWVGVPLIYMYMALIVGTALYRIRQHKNHH
ncbi:TRAP-type C4-dicarboxylate transport system permease small subunit [Desulfobaculum xiamenense]|uniref:TRAP-type C4-dicarboxylate transport system permease small subunit n=1 Tax=Desulfobaculum xiamenense TaxID=995050 RepID=A0A846QMH6_9BACT|nr:hypothetical protein [Desulfobaculum xiamenense]NJB68230.1 TRAP-type C4-dicarboxylate transport system permease small subunit [Desulfobaculum xiamenense]